VRDIRIMFNGTANGLPMVALSARDSVLGQSWVNVYVGVPQGHPLRDAKSLEAQDDLCLPESELWTGDLPSLPLEIAALVVRDGVWWAGFSTKWSAWEANPTPWEDRAVRFAEAIGGVQFDRNGVKIVPTATHRHEEG